MSALIKAVLTVFAIGLLGLGGWLIGSPAPDLAQIGHTTAALPAVLGGRFIGMGALVAALVAVSEWRAVALTLCAGALMGAIDILLEPAQYLSSHLGFAIRMPRVGGCLLLGSPQSLSLPSRHSNSSLTRPPNQTLNIGA